MKKLLLTDILCTAGYFVTLIVLLNIVGLNVFSSAWGGNPVIPQAVLGSFLFPIIIAIVITRNAKKGFLMALRIFMLILLIPAVFIGIAATNGAAGIVPFVVLIVAGSMIYFYKSLLQYSITPQTTRAHLVIIIICILITLFGIFFVYTFVQGFFSLAPSTLQLPRTAT